MTKSDMQLKQDVEDELRWDPKVNAAQIGVSVDKGAVSLLGTVDTYAEKWAAEEATKRVSGVRAVAQDLMVKILSDHERADSDLAAAVQNTLMWDVFVPKGVTAQVRQGVVTLGGQVDWNYQRDSAERAVLPPPGRKETTEATWRGPPRGPRRRVTDAMSPARRSPRDA
jgi:osmotically-inducible protein OsmY